MQTRITPNTDTFNAVLFSIISNSCFKRHIKVLGNVTDQIKNNNNNNNNNNRKKIQHDIKIFTNKTC